VTVGEDPESKQLDVLSQLGGSQDAPEFDLSSQDQSQPDLLNHSLILGKNMASEFNLGTVNKEGTTTEIIPVTIDSEGADAGGFIGIKGSSAGEVGRAQMSPDWDQIEEGFEEEINTEKGDVTHDEADDGVDVLMEAKVTKEGVGQINERPVREEKEIRQNQRIKEQGLGAISIAEKAALAAQKKNLGGKHLNLKNSFAVLNNNELMSRSRKMGVNVGVDDLEKFDILKDLESARSNLMDRNSSEEMVVGGHENDENISLGEMKYLEWKSDVSDEQNFQIVSSMKTKKQEKNTKEKREFRRKKWPSS
jgi:hypothetical protein